MTVNDRRHPRRFAKLIAKPSAKFEIIDFLDREANACRENLPDPLLGRSFSAVMRYALAEFREHELKRLFSFDVHYKASNEH